MATEPTITAIIRADRMYLASLFKSTEEVRFYLCGVYLHPHDGGINVVATDGHTMGIFREEIGFSSSPQIIELSKDCLRALKSCLKNPLNNWFVLTDEGTNTRRRAYVFRSAAENYKDLLSSIKEDVASPLSLNEAWSGAVGIIDYDKYPDYLSAISKPLSELQGSAAFQPKYLKRFADVASSRSSDKAFSLAAVSLLTHGANGPTVVKVDSRDDFLGALMPVRTDINAERPSWSCKSDPKRKPASSPAKSSVAA